MALPEIARQAGHSMGKLVRDDTHVIEDHDPRSSVDPVATIASARARAHGARGAPRAGQPPPAANP